MQNKQICKRKGMTLVELIVSVVIFTLVVVGIFQATMLFAQITHHHESTADFRNDIRIGFEQLSLDVRNASGVSNRSETQFTLSFSGAPSVRYWYDASTSIVYRQETGSSQETVIHKVTAFDVLTSDADVGSNKVITYEDQEVTLEELTLSTSNGRSKDASLSLINLTLRSRNS